MKKTLLLTLLSISLITTVSSAEMNILDNLPFASDTCESIDKKIVRLDQFTEVVNTTSAFHLEEKIRALPSPGFTVSTNKKKMLRDAKRKREAYLAERKRYGCEAPLPQNTTKRAEQTAVSGESYMSSDSCNEIDKKIISLDQFTTMVNNTSAFYLEEKASALPSPGITVSTNKKKMLRDAKRKREVYLAERKRYGCEAPLPVSKFAVADETSTTVKSAAASDRRAVPEQQSVKPHESVMVATASTSHAVKESTALPVPRQSVEKMETNSINEKKVSQEPQNDMSQVVVTQSTPKSVENKPAVVTTSYSSEACNSINQELIELDQFTTMVNNTSAFHLEEKIRALPSPGFTVSTNKKKMLRDAKKRRAKLMAEYRQAGCE